MLKIGKTIKVHGLKGELKTQSFLDSPTLFAKTNRVFINGKEYPVERSRVSGQFVLLKLKSIDNVEDAQKICSVDVWAEKDDLPSLPSGRYYISDLIGCIVMSETARLGKIKDVLQYGAADVIVLTKEGKTIMLPWIEGLFEKIEIENKLIFCNNKTFNEVAVYED